MGVFIHWLAEDDKKIQDYNYKAVRESIKRAVDQQPSVKEVLAQKGTVKHPFAPGRLIQGQAAQSGESCSVSR